METKLPLHHPVESGRECEVLLRISRQIGKIPYLDPPENLLPSVMDAIRHKQFPWWCRVIRWARSPRSLTFSPLQVAGLASVLVLVSFLSAFYMLSSEPAKAFRPGLPGGTPVTLTLNMPEIQSVSVVGTFNDWYEKGYEMRRDSSKSVWTLVLQLPAGRYEYAFVLNGQKLIPDPQAEFYADDGFGNQNAVLIVGNHNDKAI
jgi:hypothetical protein